MPVSAGAGIKTARCDPGDANNRLEPELTSDARRANGRFSVAADIKRGWSCHVVFLCAIDLPCRCAVTELVLLFEVGVWPPRDGLRRMECFNLSGAHAANAAGSAAIANSPHPSSPRGHPSAETDLRIRTCLSGHSGGAVAPAEVGAIDPYTMENDGNAPGKCYSRAPHAASLCSPYGPGLEP